MDERIDTPSEFPSSPAQAALDDTASRLAEALSLVRRVARDFDRLSADSRYRLSASVGRELQSLSVAVAISSGVLTDLGAGREPATWDQLPAVRRKSMKKRWVHFLLLSLTAGAGIAADLLTHSHAVWAPTALGLLTELRRLAAQADEGAPKP